MSSWFEVLGWIMIAAGTWATVRDGQPLLSRTTGPGQHKNTNQARAGRRGTTFALPWSPSRSG